MRLSLLSLLCLCLSSGYGLQRRMFRFLWVPEFFSALAKAFSGYPALSICLSKTYKI
jgi:hypothetical protein